MIFEKVGDALNMVTLYPLLFLIKVKFYDYTSAEVQLIKLEILKFAGICIILHEINYNYKHPKAHLFSNLRRILIL